MQYLNERAANETSWLTALSKNGINTSLVWGMHDNVSPVRVANFVWAKFLKDKPGQNRYWILPTADHYLQCDAAPQLAQVVRLTAAAETTALCTLGDRPDGVAGRPDTLKLKVIRRHHGRGPRLGAVTPRRALVCPA
jgi:hypothetical protein